MRTELTKHAERRIGERFVSAKMGRDFFRKALWDYEKGKPRVYRYPGHEDVPGSEKTVWNGIVFVHVGNRLLTAYYSNRNTGIVTRKSAPGAA